jgi:hypothetical protein
MSPEAVVSQGKALIDKARALGVPMDDLLTSDGQEIAWGSLRDFKVPIDGVLVEFRKGDPIRDWHLIARLRSGRCPVASLEPELLRRVLYQTATISTAAAQRLGLSPETLKGMGVTHAVTVEEQLQSIVARVTPAELTPEPPRVTATAAPSKPQWKDRDGRDRELTVPEFILAHYQDEIKTGTLSKAELRRADRSLAAALVVWQRRHPLPPELQDIIVSRARQVEQQAEVFTLRPGIWGMSVDLKVAAQRLRTWWHRRREGPA